jgi:hypothetical protein
VVICHYQTICRNKGSRTISRKAESGKADMIKPFFRGSEIIFFFEVVNRGIFKCPLFPGILFPSFYSIKVYPIRSISFFIQELQRR